MKTPFNLAREVGRPSQADALDVSGGWARPTLLTTPLDVAHMTDEISSAASSAASRWDLNAFAQMMGIKGKTAEVQLRGAHAREATLGFLDGELVDARLDDLRGEEAFFGLFVIERLELVTIHERAPEQRSIETPLTHLLMEAHWRAEERQQKRLLSTQEYTFEEIQAMLRAESMRATSETARVLPKPNISQAREVKQQSLANRLSRKLPQTPDGRHMPDRLSALEHDLDRLITSETVVPELDVTSPPELDAAMLDVLHTKLPKRPEHAQDADDLRELAHALASLSTTATRLPELDELTSVQEVQPDDTAELSAPSQEALLRAEVDAHAQAISGGVRWMLREQPPAVLHPLCQGVLRLPGCLWAGLVVGGEVRWHAHPLSAQADAAAQLEMTAQARFAFRTLRPTTPVERMVLIEGELLYMLEEIPSREGAFICLVVTTQETTLAATWWAIGQLMEESRLVAESGGGVYAGS